MNQKIRWSLVSIMLGFFSITSNTVIVYSTNSTISLNEEGNYIPNIEQPATELPIVEQPLTDKLLEQFDKNGLPIDDQGKPLIDENGYLITHYGDLILDDKGNPIFLELPNNETPLNIIVSKEQVVGNIIITVTGTLKDIPELSTLVINAVEKEELVVIEENINKLNESKAKYKYTYVAYDISLLVDGENRALANDTLISIKNIDDSKINEIKGDTNIYSIDINSSNPTNMKATMDEFGTLKAKIAQ